MDNTTEEGTTLDYTVICKKCEEEGLEITTKRGAENAELSDSFKIEIGYTCIGCHTEYLVSYSWDKEGKPHITIKESKEPYGGK